MEVAIAVTWSNIPTSGKDVCKHYTPSSETSALQLDVKDVFWIVRKVGVFCRDVSSKIMAGIYPDTKSLVYLKKGGPNAKSNGALSPPWYTQESSHVNRESVYNEIRMKDVFMSVESISLPTIDSA